MHEERERRYKSVFLSSGALLSILNHAQADQQFVDLPVFECMPADAQVVAVQWDFLRQAFSVIFYHPNWMAVPVGEEIPSISGTGLMTCCRRELVPLDTDAR